MSASSLAGQPRLILYHKQSTSGRTRFLRLPAGLLAFGELPFLSLAVDEEATAGTVRPHPAAALREAEARLGLPGGSLAADTEFHAEIDTPAGRVPVILAAFTSTDPPFAAVEALGGRFIPLTEIIGAHPAEVELLRRAYETILG